MSSSEEKIGASRWKINGIRVAAIAIVISWVAINLVMVFSERREFVKKAWGVTNVVDAIKQYHHDHGTWPTTLEEAVPGQAESLTNDGWQYFRTTPPPDEAMLCIWGPLHMRLGCNFASDISSSTEAGWFCEEEGSPRKVELPPY